MNTSTVISMPVSTDLSGKEHRLVKQTSTGLALTGVGERSIGTLLRANNKRDDGGSAVGMAADVFLSAANGIHFVTLGNNTAVAVGDELEAWPSGRMVKRGGVITGTGTIADDLINITNHGFTSGDKVVFTVLTSGTGLSTGVVYYVIAAGLTADKFSVSATSGGAAVDLTTADYTVVSVRPAVFGGVTATAFDSCPGSVGGIFRAIVFPVHRLNLGAQEIINAARTLTASESGRTYLLALAGGFTLTLPANVPGLEFEFIVRVAPTTAYIIAATEADTMSGSIVTPATGAADTETDITGDQWNFVASTAVIGDSIKIKSDGTGWYGVGFASAAGGITITG